MKTSEANNLDATQAADLGESPVGRRLAEGSQLGRYRILTKLGQGGIGAVYRAADTENGGLVAIKVLHPHLSQNESMANRFRKEARLLADVRNPYVCAILEANEDAGLQYIVLEYLEGENLGAFLATRGKLSEKVAIRIIADVARGLVEPHYRRIVHRDIKPENVMLVGPWAEVIKAAVLPSGVDESLSRKDLLVKICDFGLARHLEQSVSLHLTRTGTTLGTPLYMPPEQASDAEEADPSSDIYSIGATFFHLLTGEPPFNAGSFAGLYRQHATAPVPSPQRLVPTLSDGVCQVVLKALAKRPEERYADAADLLADLERLMRGEPTALVVHPHLPAGDSATVLHYQWEWQLEAEPEDLWPFVSNTDRLNRAIGLPPVEYGIKAAGIPSNSVLRPATERVGKFRAAGVVNVWRENPFEWIEGKRMGVLREYEQGVFKWLASTTELRRRPDGGTILSHHIRVQPRNVVGRLAAAVEVGLKARRQLDRVYQRLDAFVTGKLGSAPELDPFAPSDNGSGRIEAKSRKFVAALKSRGVAAELAQLLIDYLARAPAQSIARIRPLALANVFDAPADDVVEACLWASREGALNLLWDILCPICKVAANIEETLKNVRAHGHCEACNVDFKLDFASSVEMIFRVHPQFRKSELAVYCVAGPYQSPHVAAQVRVAPNERLELALNLAEGDYRLRGPQLSYAVDFRVEAKARATRGPLDLLKGPDVDLPRSFRVGSQTIVLTNGHTEEILVRVERTAARTDALTAARASSITLFRELFPQEVLEGAQLLSIARVTFLATALEGSEKLYDELGDEGACGIIHEYFRLCEERVRRGHGSLIKTLAERMLATFDDTADAVRVAVELQTLLTSKAATASLQIQVGVHQGAAMIATLNGKMDYFGQAVNRAMSLPSFAEPGGMAVSQSVADDEQIREILRDGPSCMIVPDVASSKR